jgi:hypothetical protein
MIKRKIKDTEGVLGLANLPAEICWRILEYCHPVDYVHFIKSTSIVRLKEEYRHSQKRRKQNELAQCIEDFNRNHIEWIVDEILKNVFGPCQNGMSMQEIRDLQLINSFFTSKLLLFSLANPRLIQEEYFMFRQGGEVHTFPTREQFRLFLRFCQFEGEEFRNVVSIMKRHNPIPVWDIMKKT